VIAHKSGVLLTAFASVLWGTVFVAANIGVHYVQTGDFAAAKSWFERSLRLEGEGNAIARNYLQIVNERLLEAATNEISAKLIFPSH
jgi:Flp pilus assembly protein TadD